MRLPFVCGTAALVLSLAACQGLPPEITSQDCAVPVPAGSTRIFIGMPKPGAQQSGDSFGDPLDGSTAEKFDTILSSISQGQHPTWGSQTNIAPQNLIVCLSSGTFATNGQYDWSIAKGHTTGSTLGFTVEKNWKIHGRGIEHTRLKLISFLPDQFVDQNGAPLDGGRNTVIGTHSKNASGVEISDLTVDANHNGLTGARGLPLNLQGIVLRSNEGGHWIHDVKVVGGSGDVGIRNLIFESFIVRIWGAVTPADPQQSTGNIVERVTVSHPGHPMFADSPAGGAADGIVVSNAVAEVRNNTVEGYQIGYGGWNMGAVNFHDNFARDTQYGFNTDTLTNQGVMVQNNKFIRPGSYGIVIGGGSPDAVFADWIVAGNTIELGNKRAIGLVLQGQVQNGTFANNTITADGGARGMIAIRSYRAASGVSNLNNAFQDNHIDRALGMDVAQDPNFNSTCRFQNRDLQGQARPDFPDNSSARCR